jgi:DNA-binding transcriptional LysR family regulator
VLRVACSPNTGARAVPNAIAALLEANPSASVSFEAMPRAQQLVDALLSEQIDLAIASVALDHAMLQTQTIGHWELVCLFQRGHPLASKAIVTGADIVGEPFVAYHGDTLQGRLVGEWFQGKSVNVATRAFIRSGQTAAALVASGVGIAFVDNLTAVAAAALGLEWRPILKSARIPIQAVWSKHHAPSQQAVRLYKLVKGELTQLPAVERRR